MDREDAVAVPWMAAFTRDPHPAKVVWVQDDVTHERFYWLSMAADEAAVGQRVVASIEEQVIRIEEAEQVDELVILLSEAMLDLEREVSVRREGNSLFQGKVLRTIATIQEALAERPDPALGYVASLTIEL